MGLLWINVHRNIRLYTYQLWLNGTCLPLSGQLGLLADYTHLITTQFYHFKPQLESHQSPFPCKNVSVHLILLPLYQCSFKFQKKVWYILEI